MGGTVMGGKKTAQTLKDKYGDDYYSRIALEHWADPEQKKRHKPGGFAANRELARIAGAKGGLISKRRPAIKQRIINDMEVI